MKVLELRGRSLWFSEYIKLLRHAYERRKEKGGNKSRAAYSPAAGGIHMCKEYKVFLPFFLIFSDFFSFYVPAEGEIKWPFVIDSSSGLSLPCCPHSFPSPPPL